MRLRVRHERQRGREAHSRRTGGNAEAVSHAARFAVGRGLGRPEPQSRLDERSARVPYALRLHADSFAVLADPVLVPPSGWLLPRVRAGARLLHTALQPCQRARAARTGRRRHAGSIYDRVHRSILRKVDSIKEDDWGPRHELPAAVGLGLWRIHDLRAPVPLPDPALPAAPRATLGRDGSGPLKWCTIFLHHWHGAFAHERDGHRVGAHPWAALNVRSTR